MKLRKKISKPKQTKKKSLNHSTPKPNSAFTTQAFEQIEYTPSKIVDFCQIKINKHDYLIVARECRKIEILNYPGFNIKRRLFLHQDLLIKKVFVVPKQREVYSGTKQSKDNLDSKRLEVESWAEFELMVVFMNGMVKCYNLAEGARESFSFDVAG
jgi:hypothetical protein